MFGCVRQPEVHKITELLAKYCYLPVVLHDRAEGNIIEAAAAGAAAAIPLVANIIVTVIAFIAILYFINATLTWFGQRVGIEELTFQVT